MSFSAFIACLVCKIVHGLLRLFNKGGTALPGKIALKICPDVLKILARNFKVVSITGTNGKTTSSRMLETGFRNAGCKVFANRSGANLISGITTEFILNSTLFGKPKCEWAIVECDEAASRRGFGEIKPELVLVTNLFRDQLDRYGEVTHTRNSIIEGLKSTPDTLVCLNADCSLTSSIADHIENKIRYYGVDKSAIKLNKPAPELSDATHCIRCKTKYEYSYVTYAHLGGFKCPGCGYERSRADVAVTDILSQSLGSSEIVLNIDGTKHLASIRLPAMYNIYNAAGAVAAMTGAGIGVENALNAVSEFDCGFGRMEDFELGKAGCKMVLVKNPAACNQTLEFLHGIGKKVVLVMGLNDRHADGRDISWIWDVNMEVLGEMNHLLEKVVVFGDRGADMALRLKYSGVDEGKLDFISGCDCEKVVEHIENAQYPIFIMPTYTAMLELRQAIVKKCGGANFWEQ